MADGHTTKQGLTLTDGTLLLRPPAHSDVEEIVDAVSGSREQLWPWLSWAVPDYGPGHARQFLSDVEQGTEVAFAVIDDDRIQGMCALNSHDELNRTANLGYWLRTDATGAGRATRAARLVASHGLRDRGLERVEVVMSVRNVPSRRVPERLGLRYEGTRTRALRIGGEQHDAHVFAAVREDLARLG